MNRYLDVEDFAKIFGTTVDMLPEGCVTKILKGDWRYYVLEGPTRDDVILDILTNLDKDSFHSAGDGDKSRWDRGWNENLKSFRKQNGNVEALIPRYIRSYEAIRLFKKFVRTENPEFEKYWYEIFREWFFRTYLNGFDNIFEFGCGSGFNVAELGKIYPESYIWGLDWVQPSVDIVNELNNPNACGRLFDFFKPDYNIDIPNNSAVLTVGAIEQTGTKWGKFLEFIISKKPRRVCHIEPVCEWYDETNLVDYTAMRAHVTRNFCTGYLYKLHELAEEGRIRILREKRTEFGSLIIEGYSQIVWEPI